MSISIGVQRPVQRYWQHSLATVLLIAAVHIGIFVFCYLNLQREYSTCLLR